MKKYLESLNKDETRKQFESFFLLSQEQLDNRFNTSPWKYINKSELRIIYKLLDLDKDGPLLDVGCVTGRIIVPIQDNIEACGLDFSISFLDKLKKQSKNKMMLIAGGVENLPFKDNSFKTIICVRVVQHLSKREKQIAVNEMARVLEKGGKLILLNYNSLSLLSIYKTLCKTVGNRWPRWPLKKWGWIIDEYNTVWEMEKMFKTAGFNIIKTYGSVFGEPDIVRFVKLADFMDKHYPGFMDSYFRLCEKIENKINNLWPFKYLMGRVVTVGFKC